MVWLLLHPFTFVAADLSGTLSFMVDISCVLEKGGQSIIVWNILEMIDFLADSTVCVLYVLNGFVSTCSINYWKRCIKIFNCNCEFVYLLKFYQLLLNVSWSSFVGFINIGLCFSLVTFFSLKCVLPGISTDISDFL